jgi:hypothetical protein
LTGFLFLAAVSQGVGITLPEFERETDEFERNEEGDVIVVVDAYPKGDLMETISTPVLKAKYQFRRNVRFIRVTEWNEMAVKLRDIAGELGPIDKLEFVGHGMPGAISLGKTRIGVESLVTQEWSGVFSTRAKIRLDTCFTANGPTGRAFLEKLGQTWLEKGGRVFASKVLLGYSPADYLTSYFGWAPLPSVPRQATEALFYAVRGAGYLFFFSHHFFNLEENFTWGTRVEILNVETD